MEAGLDGNIPEFRLFLPYSGSCWNCGWAIMKYSLSTRGKMAKQEVFPSNQAPINPSPGWIFFGSSQRVGSAQAGPSLQVLAVLSQQIIHSILRSQDPGTAPSSLQVNPSSFHPPAAGRIPFLPPFLSSLASRRAAGAAERLGEEKERKGRGGEPEGFGEFTA